MPDYEYIYVIEPHTKHGIDYNKNGRLSPGDDIVQRFKFNPKTGKFDIKAGWSFLNKKARTKIYKGIKKDRGSPVIQEEQRVVYQRMPTNPPPVVVYQDSGVGQAMNPQQQNQGVGFGDAVKWGAGTELGRIGMDVAVGTLAELVFN